MIHLELYLSVIANTSSRIPSPLGRSAIVPQNHPHARKQSILDGQPQVQDLKFNEHSPPELTPNPSTSTFSLSLDPITEVFASPVSPATPDILSPATRFAQLAPHPAGPHVMKQNGVGIDSRAKEQARRPLHLGIGPGPPPTRQPRTTTTASFSTRNTELILYSYAQLLGTVTLLPSPDSHLSLEQTRNLNALRRELQTAKAMGGGNMNIASNNPHALANGGSLSISTRRSPHTRSASLSSGFFSLLSPSSPPPLSPQPRRASGHARSPSAFSGFFSSSPSSSDLDSKDSLATLVESEAGDNGTPLPTFDVPPAMLAIDLSLEPGQSRTCALFLTPSSSNPQLTQGSERFVYPPATQKPSSDLPWSHTTFSI